MVHHPSELMTRVVTKIAQKKECLFRRTHGEVTWEDLVQQGYLAAMKAHEKYRFGRGASYPTFIFRAVSCDLIDYARKKTRHREWEKDEKQKQLERQTAGVLDLPLDSERDLVDQFQDVYLAAKRLFNDPPPKPGSRKRWTRAQYLAVAWLRRAKRWSTRETMYNLNYIPHLRDAVCIKVIPNQQWVQRSTRFVSLLFDSKRNSS